MWRFKSLNWRFGKRFLVLDVFGPWKEFQHRSIAFSLPHVIEAFANSQVENWSRCITLNHSLQTAFYKVNQLPACISRERVDHFAWFLLDDLRERQYESSNVFDAFPFDWLMSNNRVLCEAYSRQRILYKLCVWRHYAQRTIGLLRKTKTRMFSF